MAQAQPNDSIHYQAVGMSLRLPDYYVVDELPDWRMAHFAVILPMPRIRAEEFGSGWTKGRFNGIKRICTPWWDEAGGKYVSPECVSPFDAIPAPPGVASPLNPVCKDVYFKHTPRAFHESAHRRFKEPLRASLAGQLVDGPAITGLTKYREHVTSAGIGTTRALKRVFNSDCSQAPGDQSNNFPRLTSIDYIDNCTPDPSTTFQLSTCANEFSQVSLVCAEYLDYDEPTHCDDGHACRESNTSSAMVLHVIAENCSSSQLDQISESLRRPRNKVCIEGNKKVTLLEEFSRTAFAYLPIDEHSSIKLSNGGSIETSGPSFERATAPPAPFTTVCAVPAKEIESRPALLEDFDSSWPLADLWAWRLSTGADQYFEGLPRLDDDYLRQARTASYHLWTIHNSNNGMAVVRTIGPSTVDNKLWSVTGTRFVDLALLVRRAGNYLAELSARLRHVRFNSNEVEEILMQREVDEHTLADANNTLSASLAKFQDLQQDLVEFRDRLWFEHVLGREIDTLVLNAIQRSTGVQSQFDDVTREIELRKDVYSTQYQALKIQAQERLNDKELARQNQMNDRNLLIGAIAAVLAVPPLFELAPFPEDSWWPLGISLVFLAVLALSVLGVFFRRRKAQQNPTQK